MMNIDLTQVSLARKEKDKEYGYNLRALKHERAEESRYMQNVNEAINNMMNIGRMKKLDLLAINNRSLFNYSKIKRAEQSLKSNSPKSNEQIDPKQIKLDVRRKFISFDSKSKCESKSKGNKRRPSCHERQKNQHEDVLIDEYIEKMMKAEEVRSESLDDFVKKACRDIIAKIKEKNERDQTDMKNRVRTEQTERPPLTLSRRRNSIFQAEYQQNLEKINRSNDYLLRSRKKQEKMFLRKLKSNYKAIPNKKYSLNLNEII